MQRLLPHATITKSFGRDGTNGILRLKAFNLERIDRGEMPGVAGKQCEVVFQRCGGNQRIRQL